MQPIQQVQPFSPEEKLGYLANDPRGYVSPDNRKPPDYAQRVRDSWNHALSLDIVDMIDQKSVVHASRNFFGVPYGRR